MRLVVSWPFLFKQVVFLLCLSPSFLRTATAVQLGNETDLLALLEFKSKITDDPSGIMRLWNESVHFCHWRGVRCGRSHQRVTELYLFSLNLAGSISPHIGNLTFLWKLQLSGNSFRGEIPSELGRLRRLQYFVVEDNFIGGEIPANLSSCSELIFFVASNNTLSGRVPLELGELSKLQEIYLNDNNLTGDIPHSFGNLSSVQVIFASTNKFGGNIPDSLGRLPNLTFFAFGANNLSGTIPLTMFNITSITTFDVTFNRIQGSLPSDLVTNLPYLTYLGIGTNQFTGTLPPSISNCTQLEVLAASENKFHGKIPTFENLHNLQRLYISLSYLTNDTEADGLSSTISSLTNATDLRIVEMIYNSFRGELPKTISNLSTTIRSLRLTGNRLFGSITPGIGNLVNLETLDLGSNQLTGNIPATTGKLHNLKILNLYRNTFSGHIPPSIGNLSLLYILNLEGSNLSGSIPLDLGKCESLQQLDLSDNNFNGPIPQQLFDLSSLSLYLDLSRNQLNGSLPTAVGNLRNLGKLFISNNSLSGELPSTLGSCASLEDLYLIGNNLQGTLPSSLSSLTGLRCLDLSRNNFSGEIPEYLEGLALQYLNLSFNNFEGMVPTKGVFQNTSATSIFGNSRLCGGVQEFHLPNCKLKGVKKRRSNLTLKVTLPITLGVLGLILGFVLYFRLKMRRRKPTSTLPEYSLLRVSYNDLLKATNGFSSANLVGLGSFGSVYKGILVDGNIIAVKVLNVQRRGALKSFIAECEALRNIRHRNLVKLITACSSVDYQGNDFKALLYDFMINGSLEEWLHPTQQEGEANEEPRRLNLLQRLNIAFDVASALDYLQNECESPIVHCDLKPSNVLLDSEMTGRVGDFGLARLLLHSTNNHPEDQTRSIGIKGSIGYAPPEYGMGSEVSMNSDVYSYGILLLEMFTGKRPTDDMFVGSLNLHNYAKSALPERLIEITNSVLFRQGEEGEPITSTTNTQSQETQECLISVFKIGIACSEDSPRERMDISNVVAQIHAIRDTFIRASGVHEITTTVPIQHSSGSQGLIPIEDIDSLVKSTVFYTA